MIIILFHPTLKFTEPNAVFHIKYFSLKYVKFSFHIYLNNYQNNIIIILACDATLIHYSNYKEAKDV